MRQVVWIALLALVFAACGSSKEDSATASKPKRSPHEFFVWNDPGIAGGNLDADYADCQTQVEKDPALGESPPELAVVDAYIKCMQPKGWKFVNPDAPPAQP